MQRVIWGGSLGCLLWLAACDPGAKLYRQAAQEEKGGQLESARLHYQSVVEQFADSNESDRAKHAFVRTSLALAETAISNGDLIGADELLGQAQPFLAPAERDHFQLLQTAIHTAHILAHEKQEIRGLPQTINQLAQRASEQQPQIDRQPGAIWADFVAPDMPRDQRLRLHLGRTPQGERSAFALRGITPITQGHYVLAVTVATDKGPTLDDWFVQATTNGWRVVCVRASQDAAQCADPWVDKPIDEK